MSNQGNARETAYRNYEAAARNSNVSRADKDALWAIYLVKLAADPGAQQARKLH